MSADRIRTAFLGDSECRLSYLFEPGCQANYDAENNPHDARDAKVTLLEVFINGVWVLADEFKPSWVRCVESNLHEEIDAELRERDLL